MTGAVAKRYARALAAVATESGRLEEVAGELDRAVAWLEDPELASALSSPALGAAARRALLGEITRSLALSDLTDRFLGVLADKNRLHEFRVIARAYQALVDRELGRVRATIHSPQPLDDESLRQVVSALEKISGKQVLARVEIDPDLIAGLTVEMEGRVYDGSVRTQLAHLARIMAREETAG
ncbi:MAG TPA: ATP synthase F1 subunit delta [Candidatus Binatia bacterium]|nr:ATP synthase F1 subunit delta [Candidatus Binatia bacterium]